MTHLTRRHFVASLGATGVLAPALARASDALHAVDFGVVPGIADDQSKSLQDAIVAASASGQKLVLPPGTIFVADIAFASRVAIEGTPGSTQLTGWNGGSIGAFTSVSDAKVANVIFAGSADDAAGGLSAILAVVSSLSVSFTQCSFIDSPTTGLFITDSAVTISDCDFRGHGDAAIHALDNRDLLITGNRISDCGNAGIRIWRSEGGSDGSIISENRIWNIKANDGGNGQNGNGINVFKADDVIVSDNHIADCAFTAVRLNTTNNTQVSGNTCLNSGEVAIFSEFAFSGSVIANNIVDGAAGGISMTNYNEGGHLAICTGNIVRNIAPRSLVNPDTTPFGIAAEAEAAVTGNTVTRVPGPAFVAGYGPYLSNVLIASNVMYDILIGVAVSVAPGAGNAQIANNMIFDPEHAVVGMAWADMVEPDLIANAAKYPQLTIANNTVGEVQGV
ncbi:MAG: family TAT-translocated repetitive protein [Devosia sp.]|uniref:TIGR03808 family TAT-translocated repetitive protein n=1 Tax=Devosia sp. TaxID=1871048 RepID=UPI00262EFA26|nr:TIGR03808 family TAT-translocated repetitive protein [Devosia sp.]MDB5588255.1 family TAT-translocated repetitive protein [Devosia sp.]